MKTNVVRESSHSQTDSQLADVQSLRASLDPVTPVFVLIDPMVGEPLLLDLADGYWGDPQTQREAAWQRQVERIALSPRVPLALHQHPYLVQLQGIDDPLLELTLDLAHAEQSDAMKDGLDGEGTAAHRIGGWLQSSMHPDQLAKQMAEMFRVSTEAHTKATYL